MYQVHVYKFVQLIKKGEITNYQVKVKFYFESGRIRDLFSEVKSHKNEHSTDRVSWQVLVSTRAGQA